MVGVLNLTPDSFSDGGRYPTTDRAVAAARRMILDGADILDVGAESSRPGADRVSAADELHRLADVLPALLSLGAPVSVDTYKPEVADAVLQMGVHLINDIGGLEEPMLDVVAKHGAAAIVMHMAGNPKTMQAAPSYDSVIEEVFSFLAARTRRAKERGVATIADVGIGFGKTLDHNLQLLGSLQEFHQLGVPLLLGTSRKSSLGAITGRSVEDRLIGTLATSAWALERSVQFLRVHDVAEHRELLQVHSAIRSNSNAPAPSGNRPRGTTVLRLDGIPVSLNLGVPDEERAEPQQIIVDMVLETQYSGTDDEIEETLDYSTIPSRVQSICSERPFKLLETLAQHIANSILEEFQPVAISLTIHKPQAAHAIGCDDVVLEQRFSNVERNDQHTAAVALGSNRGNRELYLDSAVAELRRLGIVESVSPWTETEPEGTVLPPPGTDPEDLHARYLNGAVILRTWLAPHALMEEFLQIERRFGRQRSTSQTSQASQTSQIPQCKAHPARTIDLDLLLYDEETIETDSLTLPHPRMHLRRFVLEPLAQIAPHTKHPLKQRTIEQLEADLETGG